MGKSAKVKIGDTVVVKDGIMCPDMESLSIAGWQGCVSEISDGENNDVFVYIEWDSITLRSLPEDYIRQCEKEGLDWTGMNLSIEEVKPAKPRDTKRDVKLAISELSNLHSWDFLGEQGARVSNVLKGVDLDDEYDCMEAWSKHLKKVLIFPFDAIVNESDDDFYDDDDDEEGSLRTGDRVRVHSIDMVDDLYGVIVNVSSGRHKYTYPLCDLEVVDKRSPNYQNVDDYVVWFANR